MRNSNSRIKKLYRELREKHGSPGRGSALSTSKGWSLWCKRPKTGREKEEIVIGAILTQRTNWRNVEIAFQNLKDRKLCSLAAIAKYPRRIPSCIRSAGFYNQKTRYLISLTRFIEKSGGVKVLLREPISKLRPDLLGLPGVGPETADSILLYALEKPVFVVDEYTRRLVTRKGITRERNYEKLRKLFEENLPRDWRLYQDFHALIVKASKIDK